MNARRLLRWGDVEESRRRRARRGPAALPAWLWSAALALALGLLVARSMLGAAAAVDAAAVDAAAGAGAGAGRVAGNAAVAGASMLWLAALAVGHVLVVFGAPFRLFWRRDAALIGRLAIPGKTLFTVALLRTLRATGHALLPCAVAAAAFLLGPHGAPDLALRHLALAAVAALVAGCLGPAAALAAGAVVASDRAQAVMGSLGGEFQAPRTSWLGLLPGLTGTALALVLMAAVPWLQGGGHMQVVGEPWLLLVPAAVVPVLAVLWALRRADAIMPAAAREVAALDQERLAHVDLVQPSRLERLVADALGNRPGAPGLIFAKDARLARRRYPIPFFLGPVGLVALLVVAATSNADGSGDMLAWAAALSAGLGAYGVVMAGRLAAPPIEHLGFLHTLPPGGPGALRAKRARVLLWLACYALPGAVAVVARAGEDAGRTALVLGAILALAAGAGLANLGSARITGPRRESRRRG